MPYSVGSLFAGIGGFDLAARWCGNAVVPDIPHLIFRAIKAWEEQHVVPIP